MSCYISEDYLQCADFEARVSRNGFVVLTIGFGPDTDVRASLPNRLITQLSQSL